MHARTCRKQGGMKIEDLITSLNAKFSSEESGEEAKRVVNVVVIDGLADQIRKTGGIRFRE